jgi:hypothetical protein
VVAAACDDTFEPVASTDLAFSVFGYLDASADTQWLRVAPVRPVRVTSRDAIDATVILEHLGTGRIIELRDSLFKFTRRWDWSLGFEGAYVHNFWTPEAIEPGAAYRFTATREGKDPAEAVVDIPRDYAVEVAIKQPPRFTGADQLRISGLKHLPFLASIARYYDRCGSSDTLIRYEGRSADDETYVIAIASPHVEPRYGCGVPAVEKRELWIVGSEAAWPAGGYSAVGLGETSLTSNVANAVGFLGGVLTKFIPYETCEFQLDSAPIPGYCQLRYNRETATLRGTVTEMLCGIQPFDSVRVQLTELNRDPARIRTVQSDRAGHFSIGALEPGVSHALRAEPPRAVYAAHTDTVTFMPGQQVTYDICIQPPTTHRQRPPGAP